MTGRPRTGRDVVRINTDGYGAVRRAAGLELPQTPEHAPVKKLPLTYAARTRLVRAGRPRARPSSPGGLRRGKQRAQEKNNHKPSPPTHGRCEAVAAERAGGERGFLFAARKAENRVPPSIKAASEAAAVSHTVAAERRPRESKKAIKALAFLTGAEKGARGKAPGRFPAARPKRALRLPKSTRSPIRGEPPQTAARATFWNIVRGGAWLASAMP